LQINLKKVSQSKIGTVLFACLHLLFFANFLDNSISLVRFLLFASLVFIIYFPSSRKYISELNFVIALSFLIVFSVSLFFMEHFVPNFKYTIFACFLCFFYFKKLPNILSLRENFKTKAITVSITWISLCVGFLTQKVELLEIIPFMLSQFLFVWALTIPFDFADVEQDKKNGTTNFYEKISTNNAMIILLIILVFQLAVNLFFFENNKIFNVLNFVQTSICCFLGFKQIKKYWFGDIVELAFLNQWLLWEILK
jgi:4-hydroxybenzoate polyprenyltransferase